MELNLRPDGSQVIHWPQTPLQDRIRSWVRRGFGPTHYFVGLQLPSIFRQVGLLPQPPYDSAAAVYEGRDCAEMMAQFVRSMVPTWLRRELIRSRLTSIPSLNGFMPKEVTNRSAPWTRSLESGPASLNSALPQGSLSYLPISGAAVTNGESSSQTRNRYALFDQAPTGRASRSVTRGRAGDRGAPEGRARPRLWGRVLGDPGCHRRHTYSNRNVTFGMSHVVIVSM